MDNIMDKIMDNIMDNIKQYGHIIYRLKQLSFEQTECIISIMIMLHTCDTSSGFKDQL
jgi:hypothetical protein